MVKVLIFFIAVKWYMNDMQGVGTFVPIFLSLGDGSFNNTEFCNKYEAQQSPDAALKSFKKVSFSNKSGKFAMQYQ